MPYKPFKGGNPYLKTADDWRKLAKKSHLCTSCLHSQPEIWKGACPKCGAPQGNREYMPSNAELKRATLLIHMQNRGLISGLKFHPRFNLTVEGVKVCAYEADAQYVEGGKIVIEDTKSEGDFIEPVAKLKIALFNALHHKLGMTVKLYRGT